MRRASTILFALVLCTAASSRLGAQQGAYMLVETIPGDQAVPHDKEFRLGSHSSSVTNATTFSTGSVATAGKASFSPVKVSMRYHAASSASFQRSLAAGTRLPTVEIRHYSPTNRMFAKTVYENVYVTSAMTEGAEEAVQQIEFIYSKVRWFVSSDPAGVNAPVQVGCWDIPAVMRC